MWGSRPAEGEKMGQELRHYWHSNMASAPKDGENFPGSKALGLNCFPSEGKMRKLWLNRKAVGKNQGYPSGLARAQTMG